MQASNVTQLLTRPDIAVREHPKASGTLRGIDLIILYAALELLSACGGGDSMMPAARAHPVGATAALPSTPPPSAAPPSTTAPAMSHFSVRAEMAAIVGGKPFSVTVTAVDGAGNPLATFSGTLQFSSTDPRAVLPRAAVVDTVSDTFIVSLASPGSQTISVSAANGTIRGTSEPVAVTARPRLVITTSALPEGTVGTPYGSAIEVFQECRWSPVLGWHYVCVQIDLAQCETLPVCRPFENPIKPCCRAEWNDIGYRLAASGAVNGIAWTWSAAANSSVPSGLTIDGRNIVGRPAAGAAGNHLVVIEATDGGLPPAHTSVSLPLVIYR